MIFDIFGRSDVPAELSARVMVHLDVFGTSSAQEVRLSGEPQRMRFILPDQPSVPSANLRLAAVFHPEGGALRGERGEEAEASVRFDPYAVSGLHIVQTSPTYIIGNVQHREEKKYPPMFIPPDPEGQCTVACPRTGESRSGRNVCIECRASRGTIKICC
jgi:hypothetical protein